MPKPTILGDADATADSGTNQGQRAEDSHRSLTELQGDLSALMKTEFDKLVADVTAAAKPLQSPTPNQPQPQQQPAGGGAGDNAENASEAFLQRLSGFAVDLTQQAHESKLPTAYGRDVEVEAVLRALASPSQLFPLVVGLPRGGKTAVVHQAANRIAQGECPEALKNVRMFEVTPARLISGLGGMGRWLGQINDFFNDLVASKAILFIRDFHTGYGLGQHQGESSDFIEVVSDIVQGVRPRLLFEARTRLFDLLNNERGNLIEQLSPIHINPLAKEAIKPVVQKAGEDLEVVHEVDILGSACDEAIELAARFQVNQLLPGSALDLLKDTLATADTHQPVDGSVVRKRFVGRSGLPNFLVSDEAPYDENDTRRMLTQRVFGQEAAVEAVLRTVALVRARLNNPLKPMGVFLFLGPTGVGKTELVKALAQIVFGGQERIVRFNMADYSNPYEAYGRLFGNPFERTESLRQGQLYRRLAAQPFAVLLLDEFEKAASNVYQSFLQLFDEGLLVNAVGDELNMRNSIIVLTSNLGAQSVTHQLGFRVRDPIEQAEQEILKQSEEYFRPEFINRLDAVCFFKPLNRHVIRLIAQREVQDVITREGITRQQLRVGVDDSVIDLIVERGYDLRFGARYLKRQIERSITYPLARQIARKRLPAGALVRLVARGGEVAVGVIEEEIGDLRSETDANADADASAKAQSLLRSPQSAPAGLSSPKEMRAELDKLQTRIARMFEQHDLASLREQVRAMLDRIGDPDFWRDAQSAAAQIELMNALSQRVDQAENVQRLWEHCDGLVRGMATAAQARRGIINKGTLVEANQIFRELARELPLVETMLHLRDEQDQASAFVVVRSAGMDSAASASATAMSVTMAMAVDWMHDLAKMYAAWAQSRGFGVAVLNEGAHEMTLNIAGYGVYALLKGEAGLHRLVRTASAPRGRDKGPERVSVFARVDVLSDLPASAPHDFKVESKPIRGTGVLVDKLTRLCTLSFGANKDRPAVQWRNALPADELDAQARRYAAALVRLAQAQSAKASANAGEPVPNGAGAGEDGLVEIADQVRVFAMHKQQSVRDLRTKRTSTQPKKVLAGALDEFLLAYLEMMG